MSPEYSAEWIRKAEADRTAARRALHDSSRDKDQAEIACFHAQQSAEKYLKALLAINGKPTPRVHDLLALARLLRKYHFPESKLEKALRSLNQYAVEIRYPGYTVTIPQAKKAIAAMERVVSAARLLLSSRQR